MNSIEQMVVDVLKWAVCPSRPAPPMNGLDEDALVELAQYHRILQPLLSRLDTVKPSDCPPRLRMRLRIMQHEIRRHTQERMAAAREISQAMRTCGQRPPIFIKGFSAYALTNDPNLLHFSGDLDPFAEDLLALWDTADALGYTGHRKDTHEWAKLTRAGVTLDVHQYYPVLSYPDDVRAAPAWELDASLHPGQWHLPTRALDLVPSGERILWAELSNGATPGVADGTQDLLFPSPALLCLIYCAHCFRSSVTRLHYMNPLGGFRLYELLSIQALARLPDFDAEEFYVHVARFSAQDAVRLINTLAEAFLGDVALPEHRSVASTDSPAVFPEHFIYGGWVSLKQTNDWLLMQGIEQLLDQLGASTLSAQCSLDFAHVPRLFTYGEQNQLLPQLSLTWNAAGETLTADWSFAGTARLRAAHELLVHFGHGSSVRVSLDAEGTVTNVTQKSDYLQPSSQAFAETDGLTAVRMVCPIPPIPARFVGVQTLPLFLSVRQLSPDGIGTHAASYMPLRLRRPV